jgi:hypothetical protein
LPTTIHLSEMLGDGDRGGFGAVEANQRVRRRGEEIVPPLEDVGVLAVLTDDCVAARAAGPAVGGAGARPPGRRSLAAAALPSAGRKG